MRPPEVARVIAANFRWFLIVVGLLRYRRFQERKEGRWVAKAAEPESMIVARVWSAQRARQVHLTGSGDLWRRDQRAVGLRMGGSSRARNSRARDSLAARQAREWEGGGLASSGGDPSAT